MTKNWRQKDIKTKIEGQRSENIKHVNSSLRFLFFFKSNFSSLLIRPYPPYHFRNYCQEESV